MDQIQSRPCRLANQFRTCNEVYEEKGELSPEEDIAILLYMESIAETGREQFKENHGMEFSTAIEELGPDMDMMIGDEEGWLNVDLSDL
jgi:hypothetical protein